MRTRQWFLLLFFMVLTASQGFAAKNYEQWMSEAEDSYYQAEEYLDSSGDYKAVCYHSHQAVEKAMKGALVGLKQHPGTGRRTADLNGRLAATFPELKEYTDSFRELDKAYFAYVYPESSSIEFVRTDAKECLGMAEEFADFVMEKEEMFY